jgi:hypothetical protein
MVDEALKRPPIRSADSIFDGGPLLGRVTATRTGPTSENDRASGAPSATYQGGGKRRGDDTERQ